MSTFGTGSTTTAGASITLRNYTGTDGQTAGTDGLVPGPAIVQEGYVLGAGGDWTLEIAAIANLLDSSERIATTAFVQNRVAQIVGGGGAITLGGLQDVNLANLADGDFIKYNLGALEWQVHTLTIGSISDVNLAGLQAGNTIVWDAVNSEWIPGQGGGGGAANLTDLGDVTIAGVANKHFLVNNGAGQFVNRVIDTTDLDDGNNIALLNVANDFTNTLTVTNSDIILSTPGADRAIKVNDGVHNLVEIGNDGPFLAFRHGNNADPQYGDTAISIDAFSFTNNLRMRDANGLVSVDFDRGTGDLTLSGDITASDATLAGIEATSLTSTANSFPITFADAQASALVLKDANANEYMVFDTDNDQIINKVEAEFGLAPAAIVRVGGGYVRFSGGGGEIAFPDLDPLALTLKDSANNNFITIDTAQNQVNHHVKSVFTNGAGNTLTVQHNALTFGGGDGEITSSGKINVVVKDNELVADGAAFSISDDGATNYISIFTDNADQKIVANVDLYEGANRVLNTSNSIADLADVNTLAGIQAGNVLAWTANNRFEFTAPAQTYTDEMARNASGTALANSGNHTGITFVNNDPANTIDATVSLGGFSINDLSDVNTGGFANGKILKFNNGVLEVADETDTQLTTEQVEDIVGPMFTNNNAGNTGITFSYDDTEGVNDGTVTATVSLGGFSIDALSDVDTTTNAPQNGQTLKWDGANFIPGDDEGKTQEEIEDIVGGMVAGNTQTGITVTYQGADNTLDFVVDNTVVGFLAGAQTFGGDKTFSGALTATGDTDLTGANFVRVPAPGADNSDATTKLYVDTAIAGRQPLEGTLTGIAATAPGVGDLIVGTGADVFGVITTTANARTFLTTNTGITNLSDVTLGGVALAEGQVLRVSNDNTTLVNAVLSFDDLADTETVVKTDAGSTFGNFDYDFTGVNSITVKTPTADDHAATKLYVDNKFNAGGGISDLDDLADVNLGVKAGDATSVALANAQILVYDDDNGANDNSFKNVSLSGDITITNAGVATIANNAITTAKINDGEVTNAKMANPYLDIVVGANTDRLNLGESFTIEGTVNEIEVAGLADAGGANPGATLTIGLPDDVTIAQDLTVTRDLVVTRNLTVNGTTTTINTTNLDIEDAVIRLNRGVDGEPNGRDVGIFMERGTDGQDAIFYFDEGEDIFKLGTTTSAHTATDFDATTTFGTLKLATLTATSNSTIGGTLGITGDVSVNGGQATITALTGNITTKGDFVVLNPANGNASITISADNDDVLITSFGGDIFFDNENLWTTGSLSAGSTTLSSLVVNEAGAAVDFRVEGDAQTHLLYTDGTNDRVGINTNAPDTQFHVEGDTKLVGALTHTTGAVVFNQGLGDFDFRVAGDNQANLLFVDASIDSIGIGNNNPAKTLDITGDVAISSTLDVTGKATLAGSLDLTTGSATGITFRSEIADQGADADQILLRVNQGGAGPVYKSIKWVSADDRFSVESSLKSEGNFTVGADQFTVDATNGNTSVVGTLGVGGATTINNVGGTADLIVQNNGADVLNVDVDASTTTVTGQLLTNDLRAKTADGGVGGAFKIRIEDNVPNALEISDATNALSFMVFDTTDDAEVINLNQDIVVKGEVNIENSNTSGLFFNSNRAGAVSEDTTLITIEGGTDKNDVVLAWDTSDNALNLNANSQIHLQGLAGSNALTIGGALVANATIVMTTAGAITLDGTLDSPTINTDKITDRTANGLEVELADATPSALVIRQGAAAESYLTIDTLALTTTFNQAVNFDASATFDTTVEITGITTLNDSLKVNKAGSDTGIIFNADRAGVDAPNAQDFDAILLHVEDGGSGATEAFVKWDDSESSFKIEGGKLFSATEISVGTEAANVLTKNFTVGTDGAVTAKTPLANSDTTDVPTTEWVRALRLGDFDQVNTAGFNANDQILVWDQEFSEFKADTLGNLAYGKENAIDDVGKALIDGSLIEGGANGGNTGADTIQFTVDDQNDIINLALGISSGNLTDISTDAPANLQVLRFTTEQGANQNKYVPTTLGTAADADTGLDNGEIPTLTTHYLANQSETADLILTGRVIEAIDYGAVSEAFDGATDYAIDMNGTGLDDTVIYGSEDYGMLVV